ncbi:MAG: dephospho-CoA kinase, partial [Thermoanaerobaculia bacterium]
CYVFDADRVVADLYRAGEPGYRAIVGAFGRDVLAVNGEIDREVLSARALSTPEGAAMLNALIHPLVIARESEILRELESDPRDRIAVVEATLLLESGGRNRYDRIVVVDVDPDLQIRRGVERGMKREEVVRRMERQMSRGERLRLADYIIRNDGDRKQTESEVDAVLESLRRDLRTLSQPNR